MSAERGGVPAVAVMTEAFVSAAQMMAVVQGVPDYPFVAIAHPISSATDAQLAKQAERAVARGVEILRDRVYPLRRARRPGAPRRQTRMGRVDGVVRAGNVGIMSESTFAVSGNRALWSGRTLRAWADDLVVAVVTSFDPAQVILFGSVASGSDGPDSDIDLLVVLDDAPRATRRQLMVELRKATRHIAAPHDLLVTSVADLERNAQQPGSTEYEPAQFGITVYDRRAA